MAHSVLVEPFNGSREADGSAATFAKHAFTAAEVVHVRSLQGQ